MSEAEGKDGKGPGEEEGIPTASFASSGKKALGQVGPYKLLSVLGEGGCGMVYLAERERPVKRRVALKIIKPGMDSKQVIARFEAEEQALALLDHPNVAQVYEAGMTEAGQSYFAMEYVKGVPITEHCDRQKLSVKERLKLFLQICDAVGHAHQKGIIHRDIKPSNILVLFERQKALPKVIDFGIAKAISQPLTDRTLFTEQGQLLGTPEYMSPEQAEMTAQDIDTRSDIYSLGVVLYELLTGTLPFDRKTLEKAGFGEIQRIIREHDPPRPSTRLSSLGEEATKVAQSRRTEVSTLTKQLHKELEWIPLKAMRKERTRRYRSASELADDVQNYLKGAPLIAGPESAVYRVRKFVRRHRATVTAAAVVVAALIVGFVVSTTMYLRAEQAREREAVARSHAEEARVRAENAERVAQEQRKLAEERAEAQRRALYINHIATAQTAYREGHMRRVREQLEQCNADLRGWEWYRLQHISDQSYMTLSGHGMQVWCVLFSPDGKRIISGSKDRTIKVWDSASGAELMTLRGHEGKVGYVSFSPDGKRIVSSSVNNIVKVWDAATGGELVSLRGHEGWVGAVSFSPDDKRIVSGGIDKVKVWDAATGAELMTLKGHKGWVGPVVFSPDGTHIASGGGDRTIKIWDAHTGVEKMSISGHTGAIESIVFSPDGTRIVSGSWDETVKVWDGATGAEVMTLYGHDDEVYSAAFSPDGKRIVSCGLDKTIKVWDATIDPKVLTLRGHKEGVLPIAFSPDGRRIVSGGADETIKVWDSATGTELMALRGHQEGVLSVSFSPDGKRIVSGGGDKTIKVWDATTGAELTSFRGHAEPIQSTVFSPDGKCIVSGGGMVKVWDADNGAEMMSLKDESYVLSVAISPDGKRIVSGSAYNNTVNVWDAVTGAKIMTLRGHNDYVRCVAISLNGERIASASGDGTVKVWDSATGAELMTLSGHQSGVYTVAFSPDGKRILSGGSDEMVRVWDAASGSQLLTVHGGSGVTSVEFSPDGKTVAISGSDGGIKLWESAAPAVGYGPRQTAEAARKVVDERYEEYGFYGEVVDKLGADKELGEPVREVALQIARARRWEVVSLSDKSIGDYQLALENAETAKSMEPNNPDILIILGLAQYRVGAYQDTLTTLIECENWRPVPFMFKAMALHQLGRTEEARAALNRVHVLLEDWLFDAVYSVRAFVIEAEKLLAGEGTKLYSLWESIEEGREKEAVQLIEELRSLEDTEIARCLEGAVKWLGRAYYSRIESRWRSASDYAEMIDNYEAIVRLYPNRAEAFNELALLRVTCPVAKLRDVAKVVEEASRACELTKWKNSGYLSTLAAAYSEVGDFDLAVKRQREAIELLGEEERDKWEANYEIRLRLYESGKPYTREEQLVGWWKFDEGSGTVANDYSGNGYNGRLNNMDASSWVEGVIGGALKLDGVDDYVSIPALGVYSDSLTISAWIRRDGEQTNSYTGIVYCRDGKTTAGISFGGTGPPDFQINNELGYNWNEDQAAWGWHSGLIIPDKEWVFVAVVIEPTKAILYLGEDETVSSATNTINHRIEEFDGLTRIGSDLIGDMRYFKGLIDDVRIYSYALSQEEVGALYAGEERSGGED